MPDGVEGQEGQVQGTRNAQQRKLDCRKGARKGEMETERQTEREKREKQRQTGRQIESTQREVLRAAM